MKMKRLNIQLPAALKAKLDALCSDIAAHLETSGTAGGARSAGE